MTRPFDIGQALQAGWQAFAREAVPLVVGTIIYVLVVALSLGLLAGPMTLGLVDMAMRAVRGERLEIGDIFSGFNRFGPSFLLTLLLFAGVAIGTILCVLPGLFLGIAWTWSFFYMAAGDSDPVSCLKRSYNLTLENLGAVIVFLLVGYILQYAGSLVAIGSLVTMPLGYAMMAAGFESATSRETPLPVV